MATKKKIKKDHGMSEDQLRTSLIELLTNAFIWAGYGDEEAKEKALEHRDRFVNSSTAQWASFVEGTIHAMKRPEPPRIYTPDEIRELKLELNPLLLQPSRKSKSAFPHVPPHNTHAVSSGKRGRPRADEIKKFTRGEAWPAAWGADHEKESVVKHLAKLRGITEDGARNALENIECQNGKLRKVHVLSKINGWLRE